MWPASAPAITTTRWTREYYICLHQHQHNNNNSIWETNWIGRVTNSPGPRRDEIIVAGANVWYLTIVEGSSAPQRPDQSSGGAGAVRCRHSLVNPVQIFPETKRQESGVSSGLCDRGIKTQHHPGPVQVSKTLSINQQKIEKSFN